MADKRPAKKKASKGFTSDERAAMRERAREMKGGGDGEAAVLSKLAAMAAADRAIGERLHALIKATAPGLTPKTWYGMPAYANADGQVVCFFQDAAKFKARYSTLGFSDKARLDDGKMWPTSYALKELTADDEAKIAALIKRAIG